MRIERKRGNRKQSIDVIKRERYRKRKERRTEKRIKHTYACQ